MFKYSLSLFFALFLSLSFTHAQDIEPNASAAEYSSISHTISMYFDGWMTGDTTKLGTAMHATCQLKNVKDNKVTIHNRASYLGFFKPRPRLENVTGKIISIDVTGNLAAAKCEIDTPESVFTDYFNMMKIGDAWYIVDKIATQKIKEKTSE